jgi:deoxyribodipyrimidine photolyase-related protein
MTKSIGILFPHQLFSEHQIHQCTQLFLVEEYLFFKEFKFHKMKLAYHRATMKAFANRLELKGVNVEYISSIEIKSDIRELLNSFDPNTEVHIINPTDNWLEKRILQAKNKVSFKLIQYDNPLFLNTNEDLATFFKPNKKSFFQTSFYKQQRKKRNILMNEGEPEGGKWTYDVDNRKKYPKGKTPPPIQFPDTSSEWKEAIEYVNQYFKDNPGELSAQPLYPIDQKQTNTWLDNFLNHRFYDFGVYEDAIVKSEYFLNHSVLTPMMNIGLIQPQKVLNVALAFAKENEIPINSTEGFVRQIMGWREFIRGIYEVKGSFSRTKNYWNFKRKIPASFYDGTTGITPVDKTIKKVLQTGYCHHIERLMVLGNFMLLCEFDPKEVYRWFMELFIDAYDWVMVPNVYGMSQFADGGTFATKPYISGSNYIMKMSDYQKGGWQATWDGLFWHFMDKHRSFFLKNPRLGMLIRNFDNQSADKRELHLTNAQTFFEKLDKQL